MEMPTSKPATPPKSAETPPSALSVPSPGPHPDTRTDAVLAAALALVGVTEQGGENRGPMIDRFLREAGTDPGFPWCAAFVYHVGYWSQYDIAQRRSHWPLPKTAACVALGEFAAAKGILRATPTHGDVFLLFSPTHHRFAHTGFVASVTEAPDAYVCTTIEGNTNVDGSREGNAVCLRTRMFFKGGAHRFIAWRGL